MQAMAPKGCAAQELPAAPAVGVAARGGGQARTAALCIKRMQLSLSEESNNFNFNQIYIKYY